MNELVIPWYTARIKGKTCYIAFTTGGKIRLIPGQAPWHKSMGINIKFGYIIYVGGKKTGWCEDLIQARQLAMVTARDNIIKRWNNAIRR